MRSASKSALSKAGRAAMVSGLCALFMGAAMAQVAFPSWGPGSQDGVEAYVQPADTPDEFVPLTKKALAVQVAPARVDLGEWVPDKAGSTPPREGMLQVGAKRASAATADVGALGRQLQWQTSSQGGQVAAVSFVTRGAFGVRLGVQIDKLPGSALLRVYAQGQREGAFQIAGQRVLQALELNQRAGDNSPAGRTWWTPGVDGEEITLEIELPPGIPASTVQMSIPSVLHFYENLSLPIDDGSTQPQASEAKIGESAYCELDATCYDQYDAQRNAVARMIYVTAEGGYLCTGTLVNDKASSATPYFLTANHCIADQTVASTLQTYWFYRSPSCNAKVLSSATRTLKNGATFLYGAETPDTTLLRLNDAPPAGAVFAGWDSASRTRNEPVVGIHHPRGDLLKVSLGLLDGAANCTSNGLGGVRCVSDSATSMNGTYYRVRWLQGTTEGGSSGSGMFVGGKLTGTLTAGNAVCTTGQSYTFYARFDAVYPAIRQWLWAEPTTPTPGTGQRSAVYRFYNVKTGAHFYTISAPERDFVISAYPDFQYENAVFYAYPQPTAGMSAVYRFYNATTGAHFYTISQPERDYVISDFKDFKYEAPAWYAQTGPGNTATPIYRFYNVKTGAHFYSASAAERDFVIAEFKDFHYEAIAYYIWTTP